MHTKKQFSFKDSLVAMLALGVLLFSPYGLNLAVITPVFAENNHGGRDHNNDGHTDNGRGPNHDNEGRNGDNGEGGGHGHHNDHDNNGNDHDTDDDDHHDNGHGNDAEDDEDSEDEDNDNENEGEDGEDGEDSGDDTDGGDDENTDDEGSEDESEDENESEDDSEDTDDESEEDSEDEDNDSDDESEDESDDESEDEDESEDDENNDEDPVPFCEGTIVQNGSFEYTDARTGSANGLALNLLGSLSPQWDVYASLPGFDALSADTWTTTAGTGIEVQYSGVTTSAQSGNHYVELDSHHDGSNSSMTQTVSLEAGDFTLSFWYKPRTTEADDNIVRVLWDSEVVAEINEIADMEWTEYQIPLREQAAGNHTLTFAAAGTENSLGGFVDSVSITCGASDEDTGSDTGGDTGGDDSEDTDDEDDNEDTDDETDSEDDTEDDEDRGGGGGRGFLPNGSVTITLNIENDENGSLSPEEFSVTVGGSPMNFDETYEMPAGTYPVSLTHTESEFESALFQAVLFRLASTASFTTSYGIDCGSDGFVTVSSGASATCAITVSETSIAVSDSDSSAPTTPVDSTTPTAPVPQVLGETDEATEEATEISAPVPQVLGEVDGDLPRTGGSYSLQLLSLGLLLALGYMLSRSYERVTE